MFLWSNKENYQKIIPVTPSYMELCYTNAILLIEKKSVEGDVSPVTVLSYNLVQSENSINVFMLGTRKVTFLSHYC